MPETVEFPPGYWTQHLVPRRTMEDIRREIVGEYLWGDYVRKKCRERALEIVHTHRYLDGI